MIFSDAYFFFISFRSGLRSDTVCDDGKTCAVVYEFLDQCTIYVKDADHPNCEVPCKLELCKIELHLEMSCPVYLCSFPDTTTTTTASPGPLPPTPPSFPITPAKYATSVAFNVILTMVAVALALRLMKRQRPFRPIIRPRASSSFENPTYRDPEENEPLFARRGFGQQHPLDDAIALHGFEAAEARLMASTDPATFEPTAPPPPYSPPVGNVQFQDVDIELGPLQNTLGAVGTASIEDSTSEHSSDVKSGSFFSAFDRFMRKKQKTQVRDPLTDVDIGRPDITDAHL